LVLSLAPIEENIQPTFEEREKWVFDVFLLEFLDNRIKVFELGLYPLILFLEHCAVFFVLEYDLGLPDSHERPNAAV